ncbi:MAG: hypothetical protein NZM29_02715 [Nitrospira sp.]|nr:hypothetical protein [Nitrospira sp.]
MIESVVAPNAYQIGRQYVTENRVRIVEADDTQISAAVIGHSGLYEQTIRLKDGHLVSKCSCSLSEEPMCRHCIAALLEYHRWTQPRSSPSQKTKTSHTPAASGEPSQTDLSSSASNSSPVPDVKLSDVLQFVAWLEPALKAIANGTQVPESPHLGPGVVSTWIANIRDLEERRRESEQALHNLEAEMRDREAYLDRLSQQLQASITEAKAAQAALHALQRETARYQEILACAAGLINEVMGQEAEIRSAARELLDKASHLDAITASFHELADSLHLSLKQAPPGN